MYLSMIERYAGQIGITYAMQIERSCGVVQFTDIQPRLRTL